MLEPLIEQFQAGDRRALSRLLSLAARGAPILPGLATSGNPARVVALTGSGGVGKSTLAGKLIETIRAQNLRVAVLACDPQSPLSGGALLGDRFRMSSRPDDDGVFIRSLAAVAGRGAVADHLPPMIDLLEAFGFDVILIETVGAGQGDTAVHELADVVVLLLQPEAGDDLQWEKAGVLEVADVVVIHKADLPGADTVEAQVRQTLGLSNGEPPTIIRVSAKSGQGIDDLWTAIATRPLERSSPEGEIRDLMRAVRETLEVRFAQASAAGDERLQRLLDDVRAGRVTRQQAADELLTRFADQRSSTH